MESHNKLQQKAIAKKEIAAAEANVWDNLTDGIMRMTSHANYRSLC